MDWLRQAMSQESRC
jgi:hypothetical protein